MGEGTTKYPKETATVRPLFSLLSPLFQSGVAAETLKLEDKGQKTGESYQIEVAGVK